ncbi:ROK family protein [Streptomyces sp. T1317-0309]|nr:ROK family protein [Streptomyces sp. T1317-0309]
MGGRTGAPCAICAGQSRRGTAAAVFRRPDEPLRTRPGDWSDSGSISNVVAELVADGLVEEAGSVDSDGGRPRTLLRVAPHRPHDRRRRRRDPCPCRTVRPGPDGTGPHRTTPGASAVRRRSRRRHIRGIDEVLATADIAPERLLGVGIGVPGIVAGTQDLGPSCTARPSAGRRPGRIPAPLHLPASGLRPLLHRQRCQDPGSGRDVVRAGRGAHNAVVVLFGSGVGACLVTEEVGSGRAVEWGHLTVRVRGRRCRCGALGCLEAYAGAEALLDRWREQGGRPPQNTDEETALTAMLAAAYPPEGTEADPVALAVLEETAEYLGAGLSDLINLFQPERILIGGWAGLQLGARFLAAVRRYATSYALRYPAERVSIDLGRLGPDAVTVGAAILPLADFFARGGRRAEPATEGRPPAWRTALEERSPR